MNEPISSYWFSLMDGHGVWSLLRWEEPNTLVFFRLDCVNKVFELFHFSSDSIRHHVRLLYTVCAPPSAGYVRKLQGVSTV